MTGLKQFKFWACSLVIISSLTIRAQTTIFKGMDAALINREQVIHLVLKKSDLNQLHETLPQLTKLEIIEIKGAHLEKFPEAICYQNSLREIKLGNNEIDTLPDCICRLVNLERIELWDNNVYYLPDCLNDMPRLKVVDLTGIKFNHQEHAKLLLRFPNFKLILSEACDCNFE